MLLTHVKIGNLLSVPANVFVDRYFPFNLDDMAFIQAKKKRDVVAHVIACHWESTKGEPVFWVLQAVARRGSCYDRILEQVILLPSPYSYHSTHLVLLDVRDLD